MPAALQYSIPPAGFATAVHARPPGTGGSYPTYSGGPFGQTVPFDPGIYKGVGHPPWLNPVYGGTAPPRRPGGGPPPDPFAQINALIKQMYGYIETPQQQEARVNREIDAQIAAQKKMLDDEYARQMAQARANAAGMEAAGQAAAAMSKDLFGAVGGEYNAAAGEIKGLSHGLTGGTQALTKGDIGAANTILAGAGGNIPVEAGPGGGPLAPGGATQAGVVDYQQGTLGGQLLKSMGEAAQFGLAGQTAAQNMKATEEAKAALVSAARDINDNQQKAIDGLNAGRLDLFHTYMNDANDSRVKYLSLLQGLITSKAATAGSLGTKPYTQKDAQGRIWQYNPLTGGWKLAVGTTKQLPTQHVTINGKGYIFNPNTNTYTDPATGKPAAPVTPPKPGKPTYWTDTTTGDRHMTTVDPKTGTVTDTIIRKGTKPPPGAKGQLSNLQIKNMVESWYTGKVTKAGTVPVQVGVQNGKPIIRMLRPGSQYTVIGGPDNGKTKFVPGAGTETSGTRDYQEVLKSLMGLGVDPLKAKNILDQYFRRGERGRPSLDVIERSALAKAGVHSVAYHLNQGEMDRIAMHAKTILPANMQLSGAFISQAQAKALKAAGIPLPPGVWIAAGVRGTAFVHDPLSEQPVYLIAKGYD